MTTDRSYRRGMSHEKAISILIQFAGIQFDPHIVETFVNLPREVLTEHAAAQKVALEAEQSVLAVA
jgi:HD-GYP domain-containing protein (c-di-GMP phosphodiesterase class II)